MKDLLRVLWIPAGYFLGLYFGKVMVMLASSVFDLDQKMLWDEITTNTFALIFMIIGFAISFKKGRRKL